ncbi:hypothetical protein ACN23B_15165 [Anabaena sp. FACHB-709]|uniref:Uncharacterized protein n=2 Tax=Nostocaceae TaxID=1162 RepID=A0A1Z4KI48_ANAVA|nr:MULTISPECIES: hypothetical protein [Nostocaceae]BAY68650.1 hypothetical protein NIES23_14380 [Trichormus variabilis NIES-23]HBW28946.1 hypothetical protein [Nostoc sp. UBA8866]MBD2170231.1 hypothetical protein [Anabaena cylindrica FACHB-318]MBD2262287.1 hypothetical protein [Anabaena sp. FACHB-709]MBD2271564.1 hypothetical protein [Nostoc sp. PCC 7120 = FACHB-418]
MIIAAHSVDVVKERVVIDRNLITSNDLERRSLNKFNYKSNTIPSLLVNSGSPPSTPADVLARVQAASQNLPETRRQFAQIINQKQNTAQET